MLYKERFPLIFVRDADWAIRSVAQSATSHLNKLLAAGACIGGDNKCTKVRSRIKVAMECEQLRGHRRAYLAHTGTVRNL